MVGVWNGISATDRRDLIQGDGASLKKPAARGQRIAASGEHRVRRGGKMFECLTRLQL